MADNGLYVVLARTKPLTQLISANDSIVILLPGFKINMEQVDAQLYLLPHPKVLVIIKVKIVSKYNLLY